MPSRSILNVLNTKQVPTAEDINVLYRLINGYFDSRKGHGMPVKFTAFDGRMPTGLLDVTSYALDVRNRETTAQRTAAFRRADNLVVAEVAGGILKAIDPDAASTPPFVGAATPTVTGQVIVHGTPAGGVLGGTYPDPSFALAAEYHRWWPKMIIAWYGSLVEIPFGWVLCNGATVQLRDGSFFTTPNMTDRYPMGAGGTVVLGGTFGNSLATILSFNLEHQHSGDTAHYHPHQHPHVHTHTHTTPTHQHTTLSHNHSTPAHQHTTATHSHNHNHTLPNHYHTHTHSGASLTATAHTHDMNHTHPGSHSHGLNNHTHSSQSHTHPGSHSHGLDSHDHDVAGTVSTSGPSSTSNRADGGNSVGSATHTHSLSGQTGPGEIEGGPTAFTSTQSDSNAHSANYSGSPSGPSINSSEADSSAHGSSSGSTGTPTSQAISGSTGGDGNATETYVSVNTTNTDSTGSGTLTTTAGEGGGTSGGSGLLTTGAGEGGGTSGSSAQPMDTISDNVQPPTNVGNTGLALSSTTNISPPTLAWYWIMKL